MNVDMYILIKHQKCLAVCVKKWVDLFECSKYSETITGFVRAKLFELHRSSNLRKSILSVIIYTGVSDAFFSVVLAFGTEPNKKSFPAFFPSGFCG